MAWQCACVGLTDFVCVKHGLPGRGEVRVGERCQLHVQRVGELRARVHRRQYGQLWGGEHPLRPCLRVVRLFTLIKSSKGPHGDNAGIGPVVPQVCNGGNISGYEGNFWLDLDCDTMEFEYCCDPDTYKQDAGTPPISSFIENLPKPTTAAPVRKTAVSVTTLGHGNVLICLFGSSNEKINKKTRTAPLLTFSACSAFRPICLINDSLIHCLPSMRHTGCGPGPVRQAPDVFLHQDAVARIPWASFPCHWWSTQQHSHMRFEHLI